MIVKPVLMESRIEQMKQSWDDRQSRMGLTKGAVLFKRFPAWLNELIHRRHTAFVLRNIPQHARCLLDVGCGYGRISQEIKRNHSEIQFQGVDLCTEFAAAYEEDIGRCFNGPIQDFRTDKRFDMIIIVTCLMYLDAKEHQPTLERLWSMLNGGGCLVCIEPALEILTLWRRLTRKAFASPTGGSVYHFDQAGLKARCCGLSGASLQAATSISLLPFLPITALHHAIAVKKTSSEAPKAHVRD